MTSLLMGKQLVVVGLDPSLSNLGMCKGTIDLDTNEFTPTDLLLTQTKPSKTKTTRRNSEDLRRAKVLYDSLLDYTKDANIVFVEMPVGSQNARAAAGYGVCIALMASIKGLIQVTPTEVKLAATGNKTETKNGMINWGANKYPDINWLTQTRKGKQEILKKNEHLADSLGAVLAGMKTDQYHQLINLYK